MVVRRGKGKATGQRTQRELERWLDTAVKDMVEIAESECEV
jgi:hypothetical protein